MEQAVAAAQASALKHPNQAKIVSLRHDIVEAKKRFNSDPTPEREAEVERLKAERKALTDERDVELIAAKQAAKAAAREAEEEVAVQAAAAFAGKSSEELAAIDADLTAQVRRLRQQRRALSVARAEADVRDRFDKLARSLSPIERRLAKRKGLLS